MPSKTRSTSRAPDVGPPTKPARPSRERVVLTAPPGTAAPKTAPTVPEEFNVLAGPGTPTRTTPSTKRIPPGDAAPAVRAETISDGSRALPPRQPVTLTAPEPARPTNPTPAKAPREPVTLTAPKTNPPTATPATKAPRERVTLTAPEPRATTPAVPEPRSTNPATPERPPRETVTLTEPNNSGPTSRSTPPSQQPTSPPVSEISEPAKRAGPRAPSRAKYAVGGLLTLGSQTSMVDAPGAGSFVRGINNNSNVREVLFIDKVRPRGAGAGDDPIVRKLQNMGFTVGDEAVPVQLPSQPPQRLGPRVDLTLPSDGGSTTRRLPDGRVQDR